MLEGKSSWESWVRDKSEEGLEMGRKKKDLDVMKV
jgi:hypothetical protein